MSKSEWPEVIGGIIGISICISLMFCVMAWTIFLPVVGFLYMVGYLT